MAATGGQARAKFWGWGPEDRQPRHEQVGELGAAARQHLGFEPAEVERLARVEDLELPPPRLEPPSSLAGVCAPHPYTRARHAYGKAYRDIVRAFRGRIDNPPDVVAFPSSEDEVRQVLEWCADAGVAAIPYGGGTSVVGGVEPRGLDAAVTIDLQRLNRVLEVDEESLAARVQAGVPGPSLNAQLKPHELTLRHYPQSWEFSTVGGWIATRAGGHFATGPTHIEDHVESIRAISPRGEWESRRLPGSGAGPSPDRMLAGSEGILGVITEAWIRVQPQPRERTNVPVTFMDFESGARAVQAIAQAGLQPSNCRLIDAEEARTTGAGDSTLLVLGFESVDAP